MPLPEKYRYLEEQKKQKPAKRNAAQIRSEGEDFSRKLKIGGAILFAALMIIMAVVVYAVAGITEPF